MRKSKGIKPNVIRGPIGKGTQFKMVRNEDGTPNYVQSVKRQSEMAKQNKSQAITKDNSHIQDRGKQYVSNYVKQLRAGIADVQKALEQNGKLKAPVNQKEVSKNISARNIEKAQPVRQTPKPQAKNVPTIKR